MVNLTNEQQQVVQAPHGIHQRILACAGSGKTTTILHRIVYLLGKGEYVDVDTCTGTDNLTQRKDCNSLKNSNNDSLSKHKLEGENIMLTTFTHDAAISIQERLDALLGKNHGVRCNTIDSFCAQWVDKINKSTSNGIADNANSAVRDTVASEYDVSEFIQIVLQHMRNGNKTLCKLLSNVRYLVVDEFQDINDPQVEWVLWFYHTFGTRIVIVGDDNQNIYTFRGSDVKHILNFQTYVEESDFRSYVLTCNYRSTPSIIKYANPITNMEMKDGGGKPGKLPKVVYIAQMEQQFAYIQSYAHKFVTEHGMQYGDIVILSRNNQLLYYAENYFLSIGFPLVLLEGYESQRTVAKPTHLTLSTIHKSKGMEWDVVFLIGCDDYFFPSSKMDFDVTDDMNQDMITKHYEEERRLYYVAITRAKKRLFLMFGTNQPSRFLTEVPPQRYECTNINHETLHEMKHATPRNSQIPLFASVSKILGDIDGNRLLQLRKKGIVGGMSKISKVHQEHKIHPDIDTNCFHIEFGNFVDLLVMRILMELSQKNSVEIKLPHVLTKAHAIFQSVRLSKTKLGLYLDACSKGRKTKLVIEIDAQRQQIANSLGVDITDVPVVENSIRLSEEELQYIRPNVMLALRKFNSSSLSSIEIIYEIFVVSLCNNLCNHRMRMFYLITNKDNVRWLEKFITTAMNITKFLASHITPETVISIKPHVRCKYKQLEELLSDDDSISHNMSSNTDQDNAIQAMIGECDFVIDDTLWEVKATERETSVMWELQAKIYRRMLNDPETVHIHPTIDKVKVYNPIQGQTTDFL